MDLWIWLLLGVAIVALLLVAFSALRGIRPAPPAPLDAAAAAATTARSSAPAALTAEVAAEIDRLVRSEQKIAAIKVLRDHSSLSLKEAKDRIEAWIPGGMDTGSAAAPPRPAPTAEIIAGLGAGVRAEIDRLVAAQQPVAAIKLLRESTGLGLKESKDVIDAWR